MKTIKKYAVIACAVILLSISYSLDGVAQTNPTTPKLTDPEIASIAVTANQIDVNYAKIAQKKSKDAAVIEFAKTMENDHNSVIKLATDLAKKLNVTPKSNSVTESLLNGEKSVTKDLNSKTGAAFDKAYVDNEVAYHDAVIKTVENVLIPDAQNAELKGLLVKALPTFKAHLEHAKMIQQKLK